jgi:tetratricopeptide (TPR) repeat protein
MRQGVATRQVGARLPGTTGRRRLAVLGALLCMVVGEAWAADADALARGLALLEQGRPLSAERVLREAVRLDPESAQPHYALGRALALRGLHDQALTELERARALGDDSPEIHASLGNAYYELGRTTEARRHLRRARNGNPDDAEIALRLGLAELALGQLEAAARAFEAARSDPELAPLALYNLGVARLRNHEPGAAREALAEAATLAEDPLLARRARSMLYEIVPGEQKTTKRWSLSGSTGLLYDDNVTTSEADFSTGIGDGAAAFDLSANYRILDGPGLRLEAGYDFFQTVHFQLRDFDQQVHGFRLGTSHEIGLGEAGLDYVFTLSTLGGKRFLDIHELRPRFEFAPHPRWYVVAWPRFQARNFGFNGRRDAFQGAAGMDHFFFLPDGRAYIFASISIEGENANGPEFDFVGFQLRTGVRYPFSLLGGAYRAEGSYRFGLRDFTNPTPSIGTERADRVHTGRIRLVRRLTEWAELRFDYEHVRSVSNLPSIDYQQNVVGGSFAFSL